MPEEPEEPEAQPEGQPEEPEEPEEPKQTKQEEVIINLLAGLTTSFAAIVRNIPPLPGARRACTV